MHIIQVTVFMTALFFSASSAAQVGKSEGMLDANLANIESLQSTLSFGAELAEAIDKGRPYLNAQQLDTVLLRFLTTEERRDVYGHIFRQINLNQASRSAIMLIPNMSERMAHEFEEYRPYVSYDQFRREIGKYVDDKELSRLESYVTLD